MRWKRHPKWSWPCYLSFRGGYRKGSGTEASSEIEVKDMQPLDLAKGLLWATKKHPDAPLSVEGRWRTSWPQVRSLGKENPTTVEVKKCIWFGPYVAPSFNQSRLNILLSLHITQTVHFPCAVTFSWEHGAHIGRKTRCFHLKDQNKGKGGKISFEVMPVSQTQELLTPKILILTKKSLASKEGRLLDLILKKPNQSYFLILTMKWGK